MNIASDHPCPECGRDLNCGLCAIDVCERCAISMNNGLYCCECSVQLRNDYGLIEYFSQWHYENTPGSVKFVQAPSEQQTDDDKWEVQLQFEQPDIIGYVTVHSDGRCEASTMNLNQGGARLYRSAICHSNDELATFLSDVYQSAENISS